MRASSMTIRVLAAIAVPCLVVAAWFGMAVLRTAEKISVGGTGGHETLSDLFPDGKRTPLRGEETGRIDFLLLGRAGESYPGRNLTDTVMIASIDLTNHRSAFLSLPRDLFVPIPDSGLSTKLNSLYQYGLTHDEGVEPLRKAVEEVTGLDLPYYVIVDFDGFEKIIDEIGGVTVFSERHILDTRYPGKNYSYETFELPAGWHTLDGATALRFARERHSDPEGDFGRAKRQQQILKAFQEKVFSARMLLDAPAVERTLGILGESVRTDLTLSEMLSLARLARTIDLRNASTVVVDAWKRESLLRVSHIDVGGVAAFILVPRTGNWAEVRDLAEHVFEREALDRRREAIKTESADILILSAPGRTATARRFRETLLDSIPAGTVTTASDTSLSSRARSAVADTGDGKDLYTIDEILRLLPLERIDNPSAVIPTPATISDTDIVILLGDDAEGMLAPADSATADSLGSVPEADPFSEYFPAQSR